MVFNVLNVEKDQMKVDFFKSYRILLWNLALINFLNQIIKKKKKK